MTNLRPLTGTPQPDESAVVEAELLGAIANGDSDAFGALWQRYRVPVFRSCLAVCGDRGAAEDAVQETFLRIWRRAETFDANRGVAAAWIMTVARNAARTVAARLPYVAEDGVPDTHDGTDSLINRVWMQGALQELSPNERLAVELAFYGDMSHSQIAARMNEPLGTIKARIRRALLRLAETEVDA